MPHGKLITKFIYWETKNTENNLGSSVTIKKMKEKQNNSQRKKNGRKGRIDVKINEMAKKQ